MGMWRLVLGRRGWSGEFQSWVESSWEKSGGSGREGGGGGGKEKIEVE